MQKALLEEEANHNLDAAITNYQAVLNRHDEQRKLAGTAVFRLGECYRKLGRTNDAVGQYQRLLREFPEHVALATLSEQNLYALGATPVPTRRGVNRASARQRSLIEEEIRLAEADLTEARQRVSASLAPADSVVPHERRLLRLKRELAVTEGPAGEATIRSLLAEDIRLVERLLESARQLIQNRVLPAGGDRDLQRELLALRREQAALEEVPVQAAAAPDTRSSELANRREELRVKLAQLEGRIGSVSRMAPPQLESYFTIIRPDSTLLDLKREITLAQAKAAELTSQFANDHPEVKQQIERLKRLDEEASRRLNGLTEALTMERDELKAQLLALDDLAGQPAAAHREPANQAVATVVAPTDAEQQEVQRIQAVIKDSPDLINALKDGVAPLHTAASRGQLVVAKFLLDHQANVNGRDKDGKTPLHHAAKNGHRSMAELLLQRKADVNAAFADGTTPLIAAASEGFRSLVELLLDQGASVKSLDARGATALHAASQGGHVEVAALLLDRGADKDALDRNGWTPLIYAITRGKDTVVRLLIERGAGVRSDKKSLPPLFYALSGNLRTIAEQLLAAGADPNAKAETIGVQAPPFSGDLDRPSLLTWAIAQQRQDMLELLLAHRADPNRPEQHERTPLHYAAMFGTVEAAQSLIAAGAHVNTTNANQTSPLWMALIPLRRDIATLLITNGADVNLTHYDEVTPLHEAVKNGDKELVELLLAHGAKIDAADRHGRSPLDYAMQRVEKNLAELLRARGANEITARPDAIQVVRRSTGVKQVMFLRDTNGLSRHTLFEALTRVNWGVGMPPGSPGGRAAFQFPDFPNLRVLRVADGTRKLTEQIVPLPVTLAGVRCDANLPLQWGDIIEIPEREHGLQESYQGLSNADSAALLPCVERTVTIAVKGQTAKARLSLFMVVPQGRPMSQVSKPGPDLLIRLGSFHLHAVLEGSSLLLSSSDLTRVKLRRVNAITGQPEEWTFDLTQLPLEQQPWLLEGDEVIVPER